MRERIKRREGTVVSAKMTKTVVVQVDRLVEHPLYGKRITQRTRFMAHDEARRVSRGRPRADHRIAAAFATQALARQQSADQRAAG